MVGCSMKEFEDPARHRALIRELCKDTGKEALRIAVEFTEKGVEVTATHSLKDFEMAAAKLAAQALEAAIGHAKSNVGASNEP